MPIIAKARGHLNAITLSDLEESGPSTFHNREMKLIESEIAHDLWLEGKVRTDEYRAIHLGEAVLIEVKEAPVKKFSEWSEPDRQFVPVTVWHGSPLPFRAEFRNSMDGTRKFHYAKTREEADHVLELGERFPLFKKRYTGNVGRKKGGEWDKYFDGDVHEAVNGRDFFCSPDSARNSIIRAAKKLGKIATIHSCDGHTIVFSSDV